MTKSKSSRARSILAIVFIISLLSSALPLTAQERTRSRRPSVKKAAIPAPSPAQPQTQAGATPSPSPSPSPSPTPMLYTEKTLSDLKRLQSEALESDYAYKQVAYLCDNIGPRLTGSSQAQRAVEYVSGEMRRLGLTVELEQLKVPHWVRGLETGALLQYPGMAPGTSQKIVLTALGGSVATPPTGLNAAVVVVNNFDELNALGRSKVQGKIVLFNYKFDRQMAAEGFGG